jgi:quinol monooxygenase YgiN
LGAQLDLDLQEGGLTLFGRFHAREGMEAEVAAALAEVVPPTRAEAGCLSIAAYRANADGRLFFLCSHWTDEAAFEAHAALPHTVAFLRRVQPLIDHPLDVNRARRL